jgi:hypothetical protein
LFFGARRAIGFRALSSKLDLLALHLRDTIQGLVNLVQCERPLGRPIRRGEIDRNAHGAEWDAECVGDRTLRPLNGIAAKYA